MKHLILLKIQNMTNINVALLQWFTNFLIKTLLVVLLKFKLRHTNVYLDYYTVQLLENLKNGKYIHLLKTIFGVLILQICS